MSIQRAVVVRRRGTIRITRITELMWRFLVAISPFHAISVTIRSTSFLRSLEKEWQPTSVKVFKLNEKEDGEMRLERSEKGKSTLCSDVQRLIQCIKTANVEDGEGR